MTWPDRLLNNAVLLWARGSGQLRPGQAPTLPVRSLPPVTCRLGPERPSDTLIGALGGTGGLTLVEVLIAMAIMVTVGVSTMLIFRGITRAWQTGELRTERYQRARLLFDLFGRELTSSVASARYPFVGADASDAESFLEGRVFDAVFFVGTLPGRDGLVERGYWINRDHELLCHDEEPADGEYATGASELCGRDVQELDLSYFDGSAWLDRWDGRANGEQAGRLPKAVYIALTIGEERAEQFETVIYIPTS